MSSVNRLAKADDGHDEAEVSWRKQRRGRKVFCLCYLIEFLQVNYSGTLLYIFYY